MLQASSGGACYTNAHNIWMWDHCPELQVDSMFELKLMGQENLGDLLVWLVGRSVGTAEDCRLGCHGASLLDVMSVASRHCAG